MIRITYDPNQGDAIRDGEAAKLVAFWISEHARGTEVSSTVATESVIGELRLAIAEERIAHNQVRIIVGEEEVSPDPFGYLIGPTAGSLVNALPSFITGTRLVAVIGSRRQRDRQHSH